MKAYRGRITDQTVSTGSSSLTMAGNADSGNQGAGYLGSFASNGDQVMLCIMDGAGNYEVSICTVTIIAGVVTISRDTVIKSSNSDLQVNFGVGAKNVTNFIPVVVQEVLLGLNQAITTNVLLEEIRDLLAETLG